jgi:dTDP-4-amino-4,6-dideoxygalactose transaminase
MAAIQAANLRVKLPHLEAWTTRRRVIASRYTELLKDTALGLPLTMAYSGHAFHIYAIRSSQQHALQENLRTQGIEVSVHYPQAVHQQKKYSGLNYQPGDFPVAEQLATEQLSLPIYPELSDETVTKVATAIRQL